MNTALELRTHLTRDLVGSSVTLEESLNVESEFVELLLASVGIFDPVLLRQNNESFHNLVPLQVG